MTATAFQPSFDDLGKPLSQATFVVVDLETTGGSADDAMTEIGAVKVRGGQVVGEFQTLVNPHRQIPPLIAVLTGITDQAVAEAPPLSAVLPSFLTFAEDAVLVAHNARFDIGFLRRACDELGYPWPHPTILDTLMLARQILQPGEVANYKLATLATHFRSATVPQHRALGDARATVDVLHGLFERVGSAGVTTLEDLSAYTRRVSPQRRAKKVWAQGLPRTAGVYWFTGAPKPHSDGPEVLYVGTSKDLRRRVSSYFTAAEQRPRMEEMIRVATGVDHLQCATQLEAEVRELRLIAGHRPRYNRRSRHPERTRWVKVTVEAFPRLSVVTRPSSDDACYFGPFTRRHEADDVCEVLYEAFSIRSCTQRLPIHPSGTACAVAQLGRCGAPCTGELPAPTYQRQVVDGVVAALTTDVRPVVVAHRPRLARLVANQRYEDAQALTERLRVLCDAMRRHHRLASITRCAELVAARRVALGWEIHVFRYGRLAHATLSGPGQDPVAVSESARQLAECVTPPQGPVPHGLVEETALIASWLELAGVRLIATDGEWSWPRAAVVDLDALPGLLEVGAELE